MAKVYRPGPQIQIDIDKDRLRELVSESLVMIYEYLGGEYRLSKEEIMEQLEKYLAIERVSTQFFLDVGSEKIPDLKMRVDPKRREILLKSSFRKKVQRLNRLVRVLK